jgi:hypothetical protein
MPRLRQTYNDCVVVVFCYITGEDRPAASFRFFRHLTGDAGIPVVALTSCLGEKGYTVEEAEAIDGDCQAIRAFWEPFRGKAVMFYTPQNAPTHAVFVSCGGTVFDPDPLSPEEGEFILDHFKRDGRDITINRVLIVKQSKSRPPKR